MSRTRKPPQASLCRAGVLSPFTAACLSAMLAIGLWTGPASAQGVFAIDPVKEQRALDADLHTAEGQLATNQLQEARATITLVSDRLGRAKKELGRDKVREYGGRVDQLSRTMKDKEDSLVNETTTILRRDGMDAAVEYVQQVLRRIGLSDARLEGVDKMLMQEAPVVQKATEDKAIQRAVHALQAEEPVPGDIDPYLVETARRLLQARQDSTHAVEEERRAGVMAERQKAEQQQMKKSEKERRKSLEAEERGRKEQEKRLAEEERRFARQQDSLTAIRQAHERLQEQAAEKDRRAAAEGSQLSQPKSGAAPSAPAASDNVRIEDLRAEEQRTLAAQAEERESRVAAQREKESAVAELDQVNKGQTPDSVQSRPAVSAQARDYLQGMQSGRKKAQAIAVEIYGHIDRRRYEDAVTLFRANWSLLAEYLSSDVFVVLERTVGTATSQVAARTPGGAGEAVAAPPPAGAQSPAAGVAARIQGFLNARKFAVAVAEFDKSRKMLKRSLARAEYQKLKAMVDNSREYVPRK